MPTLKRWIFTAAGGFFLAVAGGQAIAQSGTRLQYPGPSQGRVIQSTPVQGSTLRSQPSGNQAANSNASDRNTAQSSSETFESRFWRYLNDARYREWAPVHGTSGEAYEGQSPHGAMLKMYLNRKAAGLPNQLPTGSVIVKENYAADGTTLMAVTTMYRARDYDRGGTGWYWTKYAPDGSVAMKDGIRLAGKVTGCIDCHATAEGNDYVFFND